jgi:hypothetical protein
MEELTKERHPNVKPLSGAEELQTDPYFKCCNAECSNFSTKRLSQENCQIKASLGYIARYCLKQTSNQTGCGGSCLQPQLFWVKECNQLNSRTAMTIVRQTSSEAAR